MTRYPSNSLLTEQEGKIDPYCPSCFFLVFSKRKNRMRSIFSRVGRTSFVSEVFVHGQNKIRAGQSGEPRTRKISSPSSSAHYSNIKEFYFPIRFTKHDFLALCLAILIPVTCIVLTMVSFLPALGAPPLPDFQDPTKVSNFNCGRPEEPAILISKLLLRMRVICIGSIR